jgi:thiol-disulfide isomerase/thioredoxin
MNTSEKPLVVLFYAPWCHHCQEYEPKYDRNAPELSRYYKVLKVQMSLDDPRDERNAKIQENIDRVLKSTNQSMRKIKDQLIKGYPTVGIYDPHNRQWIWMENRNVIKYRGNVINLK